MPSQWRDALELKLSTLFGNADERSAARDLLAPVLEGPEPERVAVACLKLSDGDPMRLGHFVARAITDYRDILAWAEYPRQMRLGPNAPLAEQARARREDKHEYERWLKSS